MTREFLESLDDVVHGRVRLAVLAYLSGASTANFVHLKDVVGATDGNLSAQIRTLEQAGYVAVEKAFVARKPQTVVTITDRGREALAVYKATISRLLG